MLRLGKTTTKVAWPRKTQGLAVPVLDHFLKQVCLEVDPHLLAPSLP